MSSDDTVEAWSRKGHLEASIGKMLLDGGRDIADLVGLLQDLVDNPKWRTDRPVQFELLTDLGELVVPDDYEHSKVLERLRASRPWALWNKELTDEMFANPSWILKSGDRLRVRVFKQARAAKTSYRERYEFLRARGAVSVGAQGAALVQELMDPKLSSAYDYYSFDEPTRLPYGKRGRPMVPLFGSSAQGPSFDLDSASPLGQDVIDTTVPMYGVNDLLLCFTVVPKEGKPFELLEDLGEIVVPDDYDHATYLDAFAKIYGSEFNFYQPDITAANFPQPTRVLKSGDRLRVRVFKQMVPVSASEDRMAFLASQRAVFVGAQGAALVWEQMGGKLNIKYQRYISLDKEDRLVDLGEERQGHGVPGFLILTNGEFNFDLSPFGTAWFGGCNLLCFTEANEP